MAPEATGVQLAPVVSQSSHASVIKVGLLSHMPWVRVRVCPCCGVVLVPEIDGGLVLSGAVAEAEAWAVPASSSQQITLAGNAKPSRRAILRVFIPQGMRCLDSCPGLAFSALDRQLATADPHRPTGLLGRDRQLPDQLPGANGPVSAGCLMSLGRKLHLLWKIQGIPT